MKDIGKETKWRLDRDKNTQRIPGIRKRILRKLSRLGACLLAGVMLTGTCACQSGLTMEDWEGMGEETLQSSFTPYTDFVFQADCLGTTYRINHWEQIMYYLDLLQDAVDKEKFIVEPEGEIDPYFLLQAWQVLLWTNPKCSELMLMDMGENKIGLFYGDTNSEEYEHFNYHLGYFSGGGDESNIFPEGPKEGNSVPAGYLSEEAALEMQWEVSEHVEEVIRENIDADFTEEQKAKAIYQYLVQNFEPVTKVKDIDSESAMLEIGMREALLNEYGTSVHFAQIYNFYLAQLGVDSIMVADYVTMIDTENAVEGLEEYLFDAVHYYNCVSIEGKWYMMDITYEMAEYHNNLESGGEAELGMTYFGMSQDTRRISRPDGYLTIQGPYYVGKVMEVPECPEDLFMVKEE